MRSVTLPSVASFLVVALVGVSPSRATDNTWLAPPPEVLEVLRARETPIAFVSPTGDTVLLARPRRYPPIADLARPMLRLAGLRVDPQANAPHAEPYYAEISLLRTSGGREQPIALPDDARITRIRWSADGRRFAFARRTWDALELWTGDARSGEVRKVEGIQLNPLLGSEIQWMPDQRTLLVKRVPPDRGMAPVRPLSPAGPKIQESFGGSASSTYEARDVLTGPHDEALFEHHALSQLVFVDVESSSITPVGPAGLLASAAISPDGQWLLVNRLHRPFSYLVAWYRFPHYVEVWDREGRSVHVVTRAPLADRIPIHGVPEGPRDVTWRQTAPATLVWTEALDGGDWGRKVEHRDRVMIQESPFVTPAREIHRAAHRMDAWWWGEQPGLLLVREYERERRWQHVWALDVDAPDAPRRKIFDLSVNDAYADPGTPVEHVRPDGTRVLVQDGSSIFLDGNGSSPAGDRPFLDRFSLESSSAQRLFRSSSDGYEWFVDWLDVRDLKFLTRREGPEDAPNFVVRQLRHKVRSPVAAGEAAWVSTAKDLTAFTDPAPQLRAIQKRIITYARPDGVPLSFTLYLPPGYEEGTRLPTVVWAYPLEFSDPATAGQVSGTDRQFTRIVGPSQLFFLLSGYAVLNDVTMPVIGDPDTAYDTFVDQLVLAAGSAVDKAVEMGVTDRERVGVAGHSHGALMTATLLAHSDIFRAGIARSGAYNHTMRPFGFQSERRTMWKARDTYVNLSPVLHADKVNEPLLLIHGEIDQNPGTVPLQSEKLFEAVRGTGGTVRLVMLPHESHGYASREAVEHVIAEQLAWFDRWVKNASPREASTAGAQVSDARP